MKRGWRCVHELNETRGGFRGNSADHRHLLQDKFHTTWSAWWRSVETQVRDNRKIRSVLLSAARAPAVNQITAKARLGYHEG